MLVLTTWGRVGVVAAGLCVVAVAVALVMCAVGQGCWLNTLLLNDEERRRREKERQSIYAGEPPKVRLTSYSKTQPTQTDLPTLALTRTQPAQPTYSNTQPIQRDLPTLALTSGQPPSNTRYTAVSPLGTAAPPESHSLLGALSSKRDSTYSSMSEYSGKTSPTNSCRSSVGDSVGSGVGSPVGGEAQGHLSFGLQFVPTGPESPTGKLVITVIEARNLTGRDYLYNACDPYVKVVVWRERRSLRRQKSAPLHVFRTRTVRHTQDPAFNQSFVVEASKGDLKELVVRLVAMDSDKWASPSTVGEVTQPLRDIKNMASLTQRTTLNYFLAPPKLDLGEVLFGLSYLPTAQRLSVSVIKAQNLKYENVAADLKDFCPYVRVLLISGTGRVLKKKKTTWRPGTASPVWNETLIFDLAQPQVEHVTFLLVVCTRPQTPLVTSTSDAFHTSSDYSCELSASLAPPDVPPPNSNDQNQNKKHDRYLGKLALGCGVRGTETRQHWLSIMAAPRKVVSQWHALK